MDQYESYIVFSSVAFALIAGGNLLLGIRPEYLYKHRMVRFAHNTLFVWSLLGYLILPACFSLQVCASKQIDEQFWLSICVIVLSMLVAGTLVIMRIGVLRGIRDQALKERIEADVKSLSLGEKGD